MPLPLITKYLFQPERISFYLIALVLLAGRVSKHKNKIVYTSEMLLYTGTYSGMLP